MTDFADDLSGGPDHPWVGQEKDLPDRSSRISNLGVKGGVRGSAIATAKARGTVFRKVAA